MTACTRVLRQEYTGPAVGRLKHLRRFGQGREQNYSACSAALEAFGAAWMRTTSGVFNATFLPNRSDKRQQSYRIKAVGCWFESGRRVGAFSQWGKS